MQHIRHSISMIKVAHLLKKQKIWAGANSLQAVHDNANIVYVHYAAAVKIQPSRINCTVQLVKQVGLIPVCSSTLATAVITFSRLSVHDS